MRVAVLLVVGQVACATTVSGRVFIDRNRDGVRQGALSCPGFPCDEERAPQMNCKIHGVDLLFPGNVTVAPDC